MISTRWTLVVLLLLAGCRDGCRDEVRVAGPPVVAPPPNAQAALLSTVSAQIEVPLSELDSLLNRVVPVHLHHVEGQRVGSGLGSAKLDLDLRRIRPIFLRTRDGKLITHIPIKAEGVVHKLGLSRPFETTFTVYAVTELQLDSTWATDAQTYGGFIWQDTPSITLLGISISLKGVAENAIDRQLKRLAPRIDGIIEERVNLRRRIEPLWDELGEPIALRATPPVWLQVRPIEAFFSSAVSQGDTIVYGLRVHAFAETFVGEAPDLPPIGAMPSLRLLPDSLAADTAAVFQVNLPITLSYDDADALLAAALAERQLGGQSGLALTVDGLHFYPSHPFLVARIDFGADAGLVGGQGRVFFKGTPVYDPATQTVRIDSFAYDMASDDALLTAADFVLRDTLLAEMRSRLILPLADRLDSLHAQLERALTDRPIGRHILLDGTITELTPGALYLTADGFNVDVRARGYLTARVRSLATIRRRGAPAALPR